MFYPREVFFATARSRKSLPEKEVLRAGGELRPCEFLELLSLWWWVGNVANNTATARDTRTCRSAPTFRRFSAPLAAQGFTLVATLPTHHVFFRRKLIMSYNRDRKRTRSVADRRHRKIDSCFR